MLREIGKRGLIYFDDGKSPRSVAGQISGANNVAFVKADAVLDAVPTAAEIDNALVRLEAAARNRGVAVGAASALPVSIERIAAMGQGRRGARHPAGAGQRGREQREDGELSARHAGLSRRIHADIDAVAHGLWTDSATVRA